MSWLPPGKSAAVVVSVDDVHPADVALDALEHLRELQRRHPQLRATLFTTPDWRTKEPYPSPSLWLRVPVVRDAIFHVPVHPRGTFRLDRHESFCRYLREWDGVEIALHGLEHVRPGPRPIQEFAGRSAVRCREMLARALAIFDDAGLPVVRGLCPPAWVATPELLQAMAELRFLFVASARDLDTAPAREAVTAGSGLTGVPLTQPGAIGGLVHFPTNFQATSGRDRAMAILENGGLLSIKAHLLERSGTYRALDGLSPAYRDYLDEILKAVEDRFGDAIWWTSMGEIAERMPC